MCMGLLTCKFTITHLVVVAVATVTQVQVSLSSTACTYGTAHIQVDTCVWEHAQENALGDTENN